jgi:hypothetical protein
VLPLIRFVVASVRAPPLVKSEVVSVRVPAVKPAVRTSVSKNDRFPRFHEDRTMSSTVFGERTPPEHHGRRALNEGLSRTELVTL